MTSLRITKGFTGGAILAGKKTRGALARSIGDARVLQTGPADDPDRRSFRYEPRGCRICNEKLYKTEVRNPIHYATNPTLEGTPAEYAKALG